jgi:hypothetical protein
LAQLPQLSKNLSVFEIHKVFGGTNVSTNFNHPSKWLEVASETMTHLNAYQEKQKKPAKMLPELLSDFGSLKDFFGGSVMSGNSIVI